MHRKSSLAMTKEERSLCARTSPASKLIGRLRSIRLVICKLLLIEIQLWPVLPKLQLLAIRSQKQ